MVRLSVNINKFATLRNARGGNNPDVIQAALDCERFGAEGITVHPRPDERHIRYEDVLDLTEVLTTEFNIEGYPDDRYLELVHRVKPAQATLVPDSPDVLTSNAGWDTKKHGSFLKEIITDLRNAGIRTSIFLDPDERMVEPAAATGTDRIELYTEGYASKYLSDPAEAIRPYVKTALAAKEAGMGINAGHDLDLANLPYFVRHLPHLEEVSIGHALICDALYYGLENTVQLYLKACGHYA